MLTCKEVSRAMASDAMRNAPLVVRLQLRAHLMICDRCRAFAEELRVIGATVGLASSGGEPNDSVREQSERIVARLRDTMKSGDG